ncbi:phosphate transport system substrate-binding protein [Arthrobacter silviterrae]|uniref:Phosphate-binding protein n=1 Tax=Arthrobacter silviterrae TaxID=2026658 RepID=A0ABX0D617_9MICC|nr:phosphate ABC transporter substrate-binding protein PstS [Arthrobacter silviterrae]MDQ0278407.1 phosphate transport system substrate-binding protein [Arthrobacter silviterrae]NGN82334.1 phosphate ABC transporter substrate-binding protein PstS [Arthrobacter silviterrae]
MKALHIGRVAAVLTVGALALTACGTDNAVTPGNGGSSTSAAAGASVTGTLTGTGATSISAAMDAWKAGFESANSGATVQYSPEGSGAGRKALIAGAVQFAGSDAYMKDAELASAKAKCGAAGAIDVPWYISPIAVAFNVPGVKDLKLDADTIAKIFRGDIKNWNDAAIKASNPSVTLPNLAITPVHRSDNSGTTDNFTDYLAQAAKSVWTDAKSGDWPAALPGENAKGTSGVVKTVTQTAGAITYADDSAVTDALGKVELKVGDSYVPVTAEAAAKAVDQAKPVAGRSANDLSLKLDRTTTVAGAYPAVLVSYAVFCGSYPDAKTVDLVKAFGHYAVSDAGQQAAVSAAKSAPLSAALAAKAKAAIDSITVAAK